MREGVRNVTALDVFARAGGERAPRLALGTEVPVTPVRDKSCGKQAERRDERDGQPYAEVGSQHEADRAENRQHAGKKLRESEQQPIRKGFDIACDTAQYVARGVAVKI